MLLTPRWMTPYDYCRSSGITFLVTMGGREAFSNVRTGGRLMPVRAQGECQPYFGAETRGTDRRKRGAREGTLELWPHEE